jgi:hypothetical protein
MKYRTQCVSSLEPTLYSGHQTVWIEIEIVIVYFCYLYYNYSQFSWSNSDV